MQCIGVLRRVRARQLQMVCGKTTKTGRLDFDFDCPSHLMIQRTSMIPASRKSVLERRVEQGARPICCQPVRPSRSVHLVPFNEIHMS